LFGDHTALLEHEISPARARATALAVWITDLWFRSGLSPEKSSPEILERVETRQHHPEGQGGDDRNPYNRAKARERA
jgi:hypothetical protein